MTQNRVAAWSDASLHGYLAAQPNVNEQPTYHANGLNGNPTVYFTGNSRLLVPDISAGWTGQ